MRKHELRGQLPSLAMVRRVLRYKPESGVLTWRVARGTVKAGAVAGTLNEYGHIRVQLDGRQHYAHNLAWVLMSGEWPPMGFEVDHADTDPSNNRWSNLRLATDAQNKYNRGAHRDNKVGLKGVHAQGQRYCAQISVNGKQRKLGLFSEPEEAHHEYRLAAVRHHGAFANCGLHDDQWQRRWRWFICSRVWVD